MKILLVFLAILIILVSIFLLYIYKDSSNNDKKRKEIFNAPIQMPKKKIVSFAEKIEEATIDVPIDPPTLPVLIDPCGNVQLLNMDSFIDKYYSEQNITDFRARYESEALSINDRYKMEEFIRKKESDRFHF